MTTHIHIPARRLSVVLVATLGVITPTGIAGLVRLADAPAANAAAVWTGLGAASRDRVMGAGEWWRLLTSPLLSASSWHLTATVLTGLASLLVLATRFGSRTLIMSFWAGASAGIAAGVISGPQVIVGASGGTFAWMMMAALPDPRKTAENAQGIAVLWVFRSLILANLAWGLLTPEISQSAHLTGLLTGAVTWLNAVRNRRV